MQYRINKILLAAITCVVLLGSVACGASDTQSNGEGASEGTSKSADAEDTQSSADGDSQVEDAGAVSGSTSPAESADDLVISHYADIEVENYGTITVALSEEAAPETVQNFVSLAQSGFYNGLTFHRIIDGFMIQGGDPNGNGTGGSDTTITGEFSENGIENNISHVRGAISMARSADYNSASSQFFIVQADSTYLDGQYAGFGFVTEGMEIVDQICADAEPTDNNGTIPADEQPVITSITIREA